MTVFAHSVLETLRVTGNVPLRHNRLVHLRTAYSLHYYNSAAKADCTFYTYRRLYIFQLGTSYRFTIGEWDNDRTHLRIQARRTVHPRNPEPTGLNGISTVNTYRVHLSAHNKIIGICSTVKSCQPIN